MTRILIADDNPQNLYLLESILKAHRFDVIPATNGAEALEAAKTVPPDLVVTDILMPVMDGFELCRRWKADEQLKHIPFIFYTATYTDPRDERFAMDLGADRFVIKPQKPEILSRIIFDVLAEQPKNLPEKKPHIDEAESLRQYNEVLFRKLEKKVKQLEDEIAGHQKAEEQILLANRKLSLMTEVTYQDIQNKVTALRGYAELSRNAESENERSACIDKQVEILGVIQNLIKKTKDYQQMGMAQSSWIDVERNIRMQMSMQSQKHSVSLVCDLQGLELFTDPLISRVFYNLIHNALRHGGSAITRIVFSWKEGPDGLHLICENDGTGIPAAEKPFLFDRIAGGEGKFGLFFVREFLSLSGMSIEETGDPARNVRFEIRVPDGMYRFSGT
ncbi:MAG: hybrid sensor histidine kinase/response regulator [Methanomicrobiales archaeon]|nr:hybrid sensor histidine kinase/response regulator [Methanomicrobiales archaeon]